MKSFLIVMGILAAPFSHAHTAPFFEGTWQGKTGATTLYVDQTVNYVNCQTDFKVSVAATSEHYQMIKVEKILTQCTHPTFWDFHQVMSPTEFLIDLSGKVKLTSGLTVGTLDEKGFSVAFDDGGQKFFLDLHPTATGIKFEWSSRSFEDVNFDVVSDLSAI
jgi:hypothetical protein